MNRRLADSFKIDYKISPEDVQVALKQSQDFYSAISTFDFNIFEFSKTVGRNMQMPAIATAIMELNGLEKKID